MDSHETGGAGEGERLPVLVERTVQGLSFGALPADERDPAATLMATYLHRLEPGGRATVKLLCRGVVEQPDTIGEMGTLLERVAPDGRPTLLFVADFAPPGLVLHIGLNLATATREILVEEGVLEPWQDAPADAHVFVPLGIVHRFSRDFVAGGTDLRREADALVDALLGDTEVVEPIDKIIQELGL